MILICHINNFTQDEVNQALTTITWFEQVRILIILLHIYLLASV